VVTRKTSARVAGFMFLFYTATAIAEMVLFGQATNGVGSPRDSGALPGTRPACVWSSCSRWSLSSTLWSALGEDSS